MSNDFMGALKTLNSDRGIPVEYMLKSIEKAIVTACKNTYGNENPEIIFDEKEGLIVKIYKCVVENIEDYNNEILLNDARLIDQDVNIGDKLAVDVDTTQFGRIAAQTARNIIRQGIRDNEKDQIVNNLKCTEGQVVSAKILRVNPLSKEVILKIGNTETNLSRNEIENLKDLTEGEYLKVYILRVFLLYDEPSIAVSRTCVEFVKKLFELEVPEIYEGIIEIKAVAREPGSRTKIAVQSNDANVDPIGACIGNSGCRIREILKELRGEKIDVIKYYDEPEKFIESALSPAQVVSIEIISCDDIDKKACKVLVPSNQLSLAIGLKGQNVRLASKITGWKLELEAIEQ